MSRIIGIVGLAGAGKNTVADVLIDRYGYELDSFAKPLKDITSILFGWDRDTVEGIKGRELREAKDEFWSEKLGRDVSIRSMLQFLGTDLFRDNLDQDIWINSFLKRNQDPSKKIVVADVRFTNEIKVIKELGGKIVRVKRGEDPQWLSEVIDMAYSKGYIVGDTFEQHIRRNISVSVPHISEWAWVEGLDYISDQINNNGTMMDLQNKVVDYMEPNRAGSFGLSDLGKAGR